MKFKNNVWLLTTSVINPACLYVNLKKLKVKLHATAMNTETKAPVAYRV